MSEPVPSRERAATPPAQRDGDRANRIVTCLVLAAAAAIAVASARPYAGSWNDGTRLAMVESLVDHGTLAIDRSIFVDVPPRSRPDSPTPYPADDPLLMQNGTRDRLLIRGHYYSDKPPVLTLAMAVLYKMLQLGTGLTARDRPDIFCYFMTLATSGLAYVVAVWGMLRLGLLLGLPRAVRMALAASLGLATVALTYTRYVNPHIVLLAVTSALLVRLVRFAADARAPWRCAAIAGALAGLAYTTDLGAGPVILLGALGVVIYRTRRIGPVGLFVLAAIPTVALHHAVNYAIGGTFLPANTVPEYLLAAGGGFTSQNITGRWSHPSLGRFFLYAASLLFGKRGFFGHNLPLFLTIPAVVYLLRRRSQPVPEIVCAIAWCCGTWLVYAAGSTNSSGHAASIRWFVPLLAPAYFVLAVFLRERSEYRADFYILTGWGLVVAALMWWHGPWMKRMVPFFWPLQAAALLTWGAHRWREKRRAAAASTATG